MQNIVPTTSFDEFKRFMAGKEPLNSSNILLPKYVRLDGNNGGFITKKFNEAQKVMESFPFLDGKDFIGTILAVRYFAKWKYDKDATITFRTREFQGWDEPIELLKIDTKENKTETAKTYGNYREFKEDHNLIDKLTNKSKSPFDLFISLYIYVPALKEVINYRFKGDSRSSFFDFTKVWDEGFTVEHFVEVAIRFGYIKKTNAADKEYYAATFKTESLVPTAEQNDIMQASVGLMAWMKSFGKDNEEAMPVVDLLPTIDRSEEISLDQIPF